MIGVEPDRSDAAWRRACSILRREIVSGRVSSLRRWLRPLRTLRAWDLDALARYYGTDKSSAHHDYAVLYRRHLHGRRWAIRTVLEIGVGGSTPWDGYDTRAGGQSLRMWARYFARAQIIGVDLYEKDVAGRRIAFEIGDQADPAFLARLSDSYGPFDLVIDDGSHVGRHVCTSFRALWPAVRPGGFYVIEDLHAAYDPQWEGGPRGTPGTSVALIKGLVDDVASHGGESAVPELAEMHVYAGIAFLRARLR